MALVEEGKREWRLGRESRREPRRTPQPRVCHHFAAIHVQTMWKGKLARRQAELRKLKKKKRNMRRRKAEGQKPRVAAPASDDDSGAETGDEDG